MSADNEPTEPSPFPTSAGHELKHVLEAALLAADEPLSMARLAGLFPEDEAPSNAEIGRALETIAEACADRGVELREVASGFRLQIKSDLQPWVARLWTEKPQKYSRAMLETLALIAYRQPITRGEIESVRGVSLSSNIIRSLQEREWIRIVGHRDVPGKPALFGTTRAFLDYFDLRNLDELPTLAEIKDMDSLEPELEFDPAANDADGDGEDGDREAEDDGRDLPDATAAAGEGDSEGEDGTGEQPDTDTTDVVRAAADTAETDEDPGPDLSFEDGPVDDEDLDEAFQELDQAFTDAEDIAVEEQASDARDEADGDRPDGDNNDDEKPVP